MRRFSYHRAGLLNAGTTRLHLTTSATTDVQDSVSDKTGHHFHEACEGKACDMRLMVSWYSIAAIQHRHRFWCKLWKCNYPVEQILVNSMYRRLHLMYISQGHHTQDSRAVLCALHSDPPAIRKHFAFLQQ